MEGFKDTVRFFLRDIRLSKGNYHWSFRPSLPLVIYTLDDRKGYTLGFADRLRGMISAYAYAKAIGHGFRIDHVEPFEVQRFLEPNEVDWRLRQGERRDTLPFSLTICIMDYERGERVPYIPHCLQTHFLSNVDFIPVVNAHYHTDYTYAGLFRELFRPSAYLLDSLRPYLHYIEEGYISVSFRFMQLMGDLKDVDGDTLPPAERESLILRCLDFVERLHAQHPTYRRVLVTADSRTFIERVEALPYVITLPGEIGHIGFMKSEGIFLKMFQDFYMISQARLVFMGYTGKMYKSHFACSAALTTDAPYQAIKF